MATSTEIYGQILTAVQDQVPAFMTLLAGIVGLFVLFHFIRMGIRWVRGIR